jgi:dihydroflavonol-4-reductase
MILVTGATGHIGNVLVRELLDKGEHVRVLVRPGKPAPALSGLDVEIFSGDILDPNSLNGAMQDVTLVYHLAARISLGGEDEHEVERVNLDGTRNVIAAVLHMRGVRLIYASSVYALRKPRNGIYIDENQPFDPEDSRGVYDRSKARASLAVQQAVRSGLDAVIVCPTAVIGPYDFHESEVGQAVRMYMRHGIKPYIPGAYDFVDVRDVAEGFMQAAEYGRSGEVYILGGGRLSIKDFTQTVGNVAGGWNTGIEVPLWLAYTLAAFMPLYSRFTGIHPLFTRYSLDAVTSNSHISHAKASRELGFQPRPARQAVVDTVRWFQQNSIPELPSADRIFKAAI